MNQKEHNRRLAYDALILLAVLALLTFISRLWPILLLILLGIFAAMIRLLFLSSKKTEIFFFYISFSHIHTRFFRGYNLPGNTRRSTRSRYNL